MNEQLDKSGHMREKRGDSPVLWTISPRAMRGVSSVNLLLKDYQSSVIPLESMG
jgi:hypothetical protein